MTGAYEYLNVKRENEYRTGDWKREVDALLARVAALEEREATLLRWCDEDSGAVKGHIAHADIRWLASGSEEQQ